MSDTSSAGGIDEDRHSQVPQVRPTVRLLARHFDLTFVGTMLALLLSVFSPELAGLVVGGGFLFLIVWAFVEAVLLSTWGTTPGEWLLGTTVTDSTGGKLGFSQALTRSLRGWWQGLGAGIPLIHLFALQSSYDHLLSKKTTTWDRAGESTVVHRRIGVLRGLVVALWFALLTLVMLIGLLVVAMERMEPT